MHRLAVIFSLMSTSAISFSQQFDEAADFQFGSFAVTPTIDISLNYDDNVTSDATDTISSWSNLIAPQINLSSIVGTSEFSFGYRLENEVFFSSEEDDSTDHFLFADVDMELSARNFLSVAIEYEDGHDDRGTIYSIGRGSTESSPDEFKQTKFLSKYTYGAQSSLGQLNLSLNLTELNYDSSEIDSLIRDRTFATLAGEFVYKVGNASSVTFELNTTDIQYKFALDEANPLDSNTYSALVGVKWEATAQTSGFAKIGYQTKDFDSDLREDFDGVDWSAGVTYTPNDRAIVNFRSRATTDETNGEGNFIRKEYHRLQWDHAWLERFRTTASVSLTYDTYEGDFIESINQIREDDTVALKAGMFYQFRRWFNIELSYVHSDRSSNRDEVNFDRNQLTFNVFLTL